MRVHCWFAAFCVTVAATGCSLVPALRSPDAADLYVLNAQLQPVSVHAVRKGVLAVNLPQADPGYDIARIAYVESPLRVDYYAYSRWADQPARMIEPLIVRALEVQGPYTAVVSSSAGLHADYRLETQVILLRHELLDKRSVGRVMLRAQLSDLNRGRVMVSRIFSAERPTVSEDADGAVHAINLALQDVLVELVQFCTQTPTMRD